MGPDFSYSDTVAMPVASAAAIHRCLSRGWDAASSAQRSATLHVQSRGTFLPARFRSTSKAGFAGVSKRSTSAALVPDEISPTASQSCFSSMTLSFPKASRSRRVQAVRAAALSNGVAFFGGDISSVGCFFRFSGVAGGTRFSSRKCYRSWRRRSAASHRAVSRGSPVRTIFTPSRARAAMASVTVCRSGLPHAPIPRQPQPQAR